MARYLVTHQPSGETHVVESTDASDRITAMSEPLAHGDWRDADGYILADLDLFDAELEPVDEPDAAYRFDLRQDAPGAPLEDLSGRARFNAR